MLVLVSVLAIFVNGLPWIHDGLNGLHVAVRPRAWRALGLRVTDLTPDRGSVRLIQRTFRILVYFLHCLALRVERLPLLKVSVLCIHGRVQWLIVATFAGFLRLSRYWGLLILLLNIALSQLFVHLCVVVSKSF